MSELASAMFSIADANEFRFARFYIVCEGVMLGTLKSPIIICRLRTHPWSVQSLERHGSSGMPGAVWIRNAGFCDQNCCRQFQPEHFIILFLTCPGFPLPYPRDALRGFCTPDVFYTARPRKRVSSSIGIGLEYL